MNEFERTPVIELAPIVSAERKGRKPILRSAAVIIGSLTLTAGFAKAMDSGADEPKLAIATLDSLPETTDTTVLEETTTTVVLDTDTTLPADTTTPVETTIPLVQDPDTTTTSPDTTTTTSPTNSTDPGDGTQPGTTMPPETTNPMGTVDTTPVDLYREYCEPKGWVACAEYAIYRADGSFKTSNVLNSEWSLDYIASTIGKAEGDYAVKIRDIYPL